MLRSVRCLLSLSTALCLSCAHEPPVHSKFTFADLQQKKELPSQPGATLLAPAQVDKDLDLLLYGLERGYGGRAFVPAKDWSALVAKLEALRGQPRTVESFCDEVADSLWLLPDAHLSAQRQSPGDDTKIRCGTAFKAAKRSPSVGANYATDDKRPWLAEFISSGQATFGVIAIKRFASNGDPVWADFDMALKDLLRNDGIVIDMRGNGGGDDSKAYQLAKALVDGPVSSGAIRTHRRQTPETATLWLNMLDRMGRGDDDILAPHLQQMYSNTEKARMEAMTSKQEYKVFDEAPFVLKLGPSAFKGPIAILVDEGCASSCESGLEVLRLHPNAKVFGQRTAGYIHFGDVGSLGLPTSGIRVGIPTKYNEYPGGKFYDKVGFEPDVVVPSGSDAFAQAAAWEMSQVPKAKPVSGADFVLPQAMREAEVQRLTILGLKVPPQGFPLEKPFASPLSRQSFVVPQGWLMRRVPKVVFAPALRADLQVLQSAMQRAYGGWQVAEQHGWDWTKWFTEWDATLSSAGENWIPVQRAFEPVRRFQLFQLDNHTTIPLGLRFGGGSVSAILQEAPTGPCTVLRNGSGTEFPLNPKDPAQLVKPAQRFDGAALSATRYISSPSIRGSISAVKCGEKWIGAAAVRGTDSKLRQASLEALASGGKDRPQLRRLSEQVAYLRLPSFYKDNSEIIERERSSWPKPTGKEKVLVVDLRGNEGGDAAFEALDGWIEMKELKPLLAFNKRSGASCLYPALRWGYANMSSLNLKLPLTTSMRDGLQSALDDLAKPDDAACPPRFEDVRTTRHYKDRTRGKAPRKGRPTIMLVVDNECGSDCELMTNTLAKLPETVVVGTNTFGVMQYIQPGYSVLPNTRLPFRIALGTSDVYGDNRSTDGYGLDVDVLIDGDDAWSKNSLIRLAEMLAKPSTAPKAKHASAGEGPTEANRP